MENTWSILFERRSDVSPAAFNGATEEATAWAPTRRKQAEEPEVVVEEPVDPGPPPPSMPEILADAVSQARIFWSDERTALEAKWTECEAALTADIQAAHERGLAEGRAEVAPEIDEVRDQLADGIGQLGVALEGVTAALKKEAVELGIAIARAVVGAELSTDPARVADIVERALRDAPRTGGEVVVRCHPDDAEAIETRLPSMDALRADPLNLRIAASDRVEPGGCIVDFPDGSIDARPSLALDLIAQAVRDSLMHAQSDPHSAPQVDTVEDVEEDSLVEGMALAETPVATLEETPAPSDAEAEEVQ